MKHTQRKSYLYHLLLMILSPAFALWHGLRFRSSLTYRSKRWLLILFVMISGAIMTYNPGADAYRHQQAVYEHYENLPFRQFIQEAWEILTFQSNASPSKDLYIHVLSYFLGTVLSMPGLFFLFVGFLFGYFYAASIFRLFKEYVKKSYHWVFYILSTVFILTLSVHEMSTVRTWTGFWILFYACLSYYQTKKRKYLFLMFVSPLIHIAYFILAIPAWFVLVVGTKRKLYSWIFALSFIASVPGTQALFKSVKNSSDIGAYVVQAYGVTKEEHLSSDENNVQFKADSPWYKRLNELGLQEWAIYLLVGVLIIFGVYSKKMGALEAKLFSIGILYYAFSNLTWMFFAVSNRSSNIALEFTLAAVLLVWRRNGWWNTSFRAKYWIKWLTKISAILFIPFIVYSIAFLIYFVSVYMLAFPFIPWISGFSNYSLRELAGFLLPFS